MLDSNLDSEQRALTNTVWARYKEEGEWPTFAVVDRDLDDIGVDAEAVLERCPPGLVRGSQWVSCSLDRKVELDLRSLRLIPAASQVLSDVALVVRLFVVAERDFRPDRGGPPQPTITSDEMTSLVAAETGHALDSDLARRIGRVGPLVQQLRIWSACGTRIDGGWSITLDRAVRKFRHVTTVDALLARMDELNATSPGHVSEIMNDPSEEDAVLVTTEEPDVDPRAVFVVHGRDMQAKAALTGFLRDLDLRPIEWEELVARTGTGAPYVGDAVSVAFQLAQAVVVLVTPDDEVRLHPALHGPEEPIEETVYSGQPRPNVLFEAGMALASHPDRTIIAVAGNIKKWSDIAGRHTVHLTGASGTLVALANRLKNAGCPVRRDGADWLNQTRFAELHAHTRRPDHVDDREDTSGFLPVGTVLRSGSPKPAEPQLSARLLPNGRGYLLEIANRGGCAMTNVSIDVPDDAHWLVHLKVLPEYPIANLDPRGHARIPVMMVSGSAKVVDVVLRATLESGGDYETKHRVSVYG